MGGGGGDRSYTTSRSRTTTPIKVFVFVYLIFEYFRKERNIARLRISLQISLFLSFAAKIHLYVMTQYPIYTFLSR